MLDGPLLKLENGKFSLVSETPAFLTRVEEVIETGNLAAWDDILEAAGLEKANSFRSAAGSFEFGSIDLWVLKGEGHPDVYYAEAVDSNGPIWRAIFGAVELPDFYSRYVLPMISAAALCNLQANTEDLQKVAKQRFQD